MPDPFFDQPILNSPYEYPGRHWELDSTGQPTQRIVDHRRRAEFITPIPQPRQKKKSKQIQTEMMFDEGAGLSSKGQRYDPTSMINQVRQQVDRWRTLPDPATWKDLQTLETEGQMLQRVMPDLMGMKNIVVLNDEAHHCYREKPGEDEEGDLKGDDQEEAKQNREAARLWINGLETVNRKLGVQRNFDLSATPSFLRGSGYAEGTMFPWTVSDFSLMDAIECGIVKLPRVPVADNIPGDDMPMYRNLWEHIRTKMPKKGRGKAKALDPLDLPPQLQTALEALYGHYKQTFDLWQKQSIPVPPCFILVCNNTSTSKLVYDYVSGFERQNEDGSTLADPGILPAGAQLFRPDNLTNQRPIGAGDVASFEYEGRTYTPGKGKFKTDKEGLDHLALDSRLYPTTGGTIQYVRFLNDFPAVAISNVWTDVGTGSFTDSKVYVVQTNTKIIQRCLLMATDPCDLVLDPTCGSGTTAYVAEQWGRRWITIDTSRVALALARARIMGARYPYYLLADSPEGQQKEAEVARRPLTDVRGSLTRGDVRHGFVYERVPHITLKSIANNAEIDVIWEKYQGELSVLSRQLSEKTGRDKPFEEWEIPREPGTPWPEKAAKEHERFLKAKTDAARTRAVAQINKLLKRKYGLDDVPEHPADLWEDEDAIALHAQWWKLRIARQKEIDASIAAKAEHEYLYDKPYEDKSKVRVAGPFTVESLSPHRVLTVGADDELIDPREALQHQSPDAQDFAQVILDNLKAAGVQQAHKEDKIDFTSLAVWPGYYVCAQGRYVEGDPESGAEKRAGIFIGPEFGTVSRQDLVLAARECADAGFDVLIACAFNYEAHASEFNKLGRIPVLKARMNADLHMAGELKETNKANLFVIFGEPDIEILDADDDQIQVKIHGVEVFHPNSGEVHSDTADGIACWFIDTDYNEEGFFVRHAYFLGAGDPYKSLKTSLKAEINEDAWATLNSDTSRPFDNPKTGRIAVKVTNHLGDKVMKVFEV